MTTPIKGGSSFTATAIWSAGSTTHLKPNRYALLHTEVESSHRHRGVGSAVVRQVLDEIRAREGTITAMCPFVADYLSRTTAHTDLIDARHPGYSDRTAAESVRTKATG
ncbi:GNAT family N-acetyltransferase [Nonomuraea rubra]|uniref:Putative GNAT family acetyltransferase n=1 Tax=Nonomuraea rubra TaxID=46180 RepID=A0A7X0P1H8_9ACTN|nr:GNAT family N-acetyltransferase [Nonomuraea rubra]MBB6553533.1 putative GNAT family acetyltransferase [Nonomuraea rubra]